MDDFFALPAFKPQDALVNLRRQLRELKLTERAGGELVRFELAGDTVVELKAEADAIAARIARRPARTPEWDSRRIASSADLRAFADDAKKRVSRWNDDRD
ncbi:MAG: hypothetical protein EPO01_12080 [Aquabacterium sp.]|nr:MAG: hypothetical protein EPO01_12080 [Aquabacterium sp.]